MKEILKKLVEPFDFSDIEVRVHNTNSEKTKGMVFYYVTNRAIQNRLDEIFGPFGWKNEFKDWQGNAQLCGISIKVPGEDQWVTKWDGAENTNIEAIKGGLSDSMKRSAVQWGIGRYLYLLEEVWVDVEQKGKGVYIKKDQHYKLEKIYNNHVKLLTGKRPEMSVAPQEAKSVTVVNEPAKAEPKAETQEAVKATNDKPSTKQISWLLSERELLGLTEAEVKALSRQEAKTQIERLVKLKSQGEKKEASPVAKEEINNEEYCSPMQGNYLNALMKSLISKTNVSEAQVISALKKKYSILEKENGQIAVKQSDFNKVQADLKDVSLVK